MAYVRAILVYLTLIAAVRLLGKRQIGQLEPSEFVVAMLLADLAAIPMQDASLPLLSGLVPIFAVVGLELLLSFAIMKSVPVRKFLCGKPVILIDNGKILQDNLRRTRVTLDELSGHLRQKDVLDIRDVQFAILETDGTLSVFPYPKYRPASAKDAGIRAGRQYLPVTLIQDGIVCRENLKKTGKDIQWLRQELARHDADPGSTFLLTLDESGRVVWIGKEAP